MGEEHTRLRTVMLQKERLSFIKSTIYSAINFQKFAQLAMT